MRKKLLFILLVADLLLLFFSYFLKNYLQPVAIVVPHHNIVKEERLELLEIIAAKRPKTKTIIILSPDHFSPNQYRIFYTDKTWELSNGMLEFDEELGPKIIVGFAKENGLVANDHGIYNLLPDIKKVWPKAKIIPLLIGQEVRFNKLNDLIFKLNSNCRDDCLLIASMDFSHYLPRALADIHDMKSYEALESMKIKSENSIEVDSAQSLYTLMNYASFKQAKKLHFYSHTNSGVIENNRDAETTSHFFGWYQKDFFQSRENKILTFLIAKDLNEKKDKETLGERFFYGVDYFDGQLKKNFKPSLRLVIEPSEKFSEVDIVKGELKVLLGDDLAVAGYVFSDKITLVFLPLKKQGFENYLMRGNEKTKFLKDLLQTISSKGSFVDIKEGIVVL